MYAVRNDGLGWRMVSGEMDVMDGEYYSLEVPEPTLAILKGEKNKEINAARLRANQSKFTHAGKEIQCDQLSRSDIDGIANYIGLFGVYPPDFGKAWKTLDNDYILLPTVDDFKAFYGSMTAQGAANFDHSQELKQALLLANTAEEVAAIQW